MKKSNCLKNVAVKPKKCYFLRGENMAETAEQKIMKSLKTIEEWALQGMTESEIAELLGVGYSTFRKIKRQNVALLALLKHCAKLKRDTIKTQVEQVERSLFERAKGYDYETTENIKVKQTGYDEKGKKWEKETIETIPKKVHVPADIQAAKFFLINAAKKKWQDNPHKVEIDKKNMKLKEKEVEGKTWQ